MKFNLLLAVLFIVLISGFNSGKIKDPYTFDNPFKDELEIVSSLSSQDEPSKDVEQQIQEIIDENEQNLIENEKIYNDNIQTCEGDHQFRLLLENQALLAENNAKTHQAQCQQAKTFSETHVRNLEAEINYNNQKIDSLTAVRQREAEKYAQDVSEHQAAFEGLLEAVEVVEQFKNLKSYDEENISVFTQIAKSLIQIRNLNALSKVVLIQTQLLAAQDEPGTLSLESIEKILNMLSELAEEISNHLDNLTQLENDAINAFESHIALLKSLNQKKSEEIANEQIYAAEATQCINNEESIITEAQAKFQSNKSIDEVSQKSCEIHKVQFEAEKPERQKYVQMLKKLLQIIVDAKGAYSYGLYTKP